MKKILAVLLMAVISVGRPLDATSADAVDTFDTCDTSTRNYCEALIRGRDPIKLERCTGNFDFSVSKQDQLLRCYKLEQTNNGGDKESETGHTVWALKIFFGGLASYLAAKFLWHMLVRLNYRVGNNANIGLPGVPLVDMGAAVQEPDLFAEAEHFLRGQLGYPNGLVTITRIRGVLQRFGDNPLVIFMRENEGAMLARLRDNGLVHRAARHMFEWRHV